MKAMYAYHCKIKDCSHISFSKDSARWHVHDHSVAMEEELGLQEPTLPDSIPGESVMDWRMRATKWTKNLGEFDLKLAKKMKQRIEGDKRSYYWKLPFGNKAPTIDCLCPVCTAPAGSMVEVGVSGRRRLAEEYRKATD